jgi:hypothetical protein
MERSRSQASRRQAAIMGRLERGPRWLSAGRTRRTAAKKGASVPDGYRRGTERRDCSACRNRRGCMQDGLQRLPFDDHSVGRFEAALSRRLAISEGCWNRGSPMTGPPNGHSIGGKYVRKRIPVILPIDQDRRLPLVSHGCRGGHTSGLPSKLHRPRGEGGWDPARRRITSPARGSRKTRPRCRRTSGPGCRSGGAS